MKRIIEILPLGNGAHRNQSGNMETVPEGWAEIPSGLTLPDTFPFVNITAENGVVTSITSGEVPEPEPIPEPPPTETEQLRADVDYIAVMTDIDLGGAV